MQDQKLDVFRLQYDFTRKSSARLGYRYQRRNIGDDQTDV